MEPHITFDLPLLASKHQDGAIISLFQLKGGYLIFFDEPPAVINVWAFSLPYKVIRSIDLFVAIGIDCC